MLRVKVPAGKLSPPSCARSARPRTSSARATASSRRARTSSSTGSSSRSCPTSSRTSRLRHDDRRRLRRHRAQHHRLPGAGHRRRRALRRDPVVDAAADLFYGNPDWANLPRKHKYSIAACADRCNAPEINCISLIGTVNEGREGFAVLVGGGLSSVPRIAQRHGRLRPEGGGERDPRRDHVASGRRTCKYRVSRVKARLKFMVDDIGPEGIRERVEARLGRKLEDYALPPIDVEPSHHLGVHAQKQEGLSYIGVPVHLGLDLGRPDDRDRRPRRALRRRHPADAPAELHRHRRPERVGRRGAVAELERDRLPARHQPGARQLDRLHRRAALQLLGRRDEDAPRRADRPPRGALRRRRSPTCGCTSTAARTPAPSTGSATSASRARPPATRAACGGRPTTSSSAAASGPSPRSASSLFRRVPTDELDAAVEGLIAGLARPARAGRDVHRVHAPRERRRAWRAGRPRAGQERRVDEEEAEA